MSEVALPETLSFDEVVELETLETRIEAGLKTFYEVGDAFLTIRDRRLYRETYSSFEDYCQSKWEFSASRARQLMAAAETVGSLRAAAESEGQSVTIVTLPKNEGQARALGQFDADLQPAIMRVAVAQSEALGKPLTAGLIKSVGNTLAEATLTGHVDTGNGESTAFDAAMTASSYEDVQRQRQHISDNYEKKDARGQWKDPNEKPTFAKPQPTGRPKPERVYVEPDDVESFKTACQNLIDATDDYPDDWNAFLKGEFRKSLEQVNLLAERFLA